MCTLISDQYAWLFWMIITRGLSERFFCLSDPFLWSFLSLASVNIIPSIVFVIMLSLVWEINAPCLVQVFCLSNYFLQSCLSDHTQSCLVNITYVSKIMLNLSRSCSIVLSRSLEAYLNDESVSRPSNCYKCSLFAQSCQSLFCLLKRSLFIFERSLCSVILKDHYAQFVWMIVSLLSLCMTFLSVISLLVLFSSSAFLPLCFLFLFISSSPLSLAPPLPQFFLSPSSTWNSSLCHAVPSASSAWLSLIPLLLLFSPLPGFHLCFLFSFIFLFSAPPSSQLESLPFIVPFPSLT